MGEQSFEALKAAVIEIDCSALTSFCVNGGQLVDVRERAETASGYPVDAILIPKSALELRVQHEVPDRRTPIALICESGQRSKSAAVVLRLMGYETVVSVEGGMNAWRQKSLPMTIEQTLSVVEEERYARHLMMPSVGPRGQNRLKSGRILVVGAGGLGSPAALYLAGAGVGTIGLMDPDTVERSNLQRQILHGESTLGWPKVASGIQRLSTLNPDVRLEPYPRRLTAENVSAMVEKFDVIVDGTDNLDTRYLLNAECVQQGKPYIYGAVFQFEGQVGVFGGDTTQRASCYACFHPTPAPEALAPSCAEAGVLGVLPGIIGCFQALEAIKWLLGGERTLLGKVIHLDAQGVHFQTFTVPRDPSCSACGDHFGG